MKLDEIKETKMQKAESAKDLLDSIENGMFTKDGSHLKVSGCFICSSKRLTSLRGVPSSIGGDFYCSSNLLTSLRGAPSSVGGSFYAYGNPIKSHILGLLKIKGLKSCTLDNKEVEAIINKYLPEGDILACVDELEDAGYGEFANL